MKSRRRKSLGTIAVIAIAYLLLSSALSWGDTTIYVYQAKDTGVLKIKTVGSDGTITKNITQTPPGIPNSCYMPDLFWDSAAGALRLNGFDSVNDPSWTGTIDAAGMFASSMTLPTIDCGSVTPTVPSSVVSGTFPAAIPCTSFAAYGACSNGFMTRTATPGGCVDPLQSIPCSAAACISWGYGEWIPSNSVCTPGQPQFRTATAAPVGCSGSPDDQTIKLCPPSACTDYTYSAWSACTNSQQTRTVTGNIPVGCTGTPSTSAVLTQGCTQTIACTGYTYSAWTDCTNSQQTRTVTGYTPASCSGTPSGSALTTQSCSSGGGTGTYQDLPMNCGTVAWTAISPGKKYYKFTVPAGVYASGGVSFSYQQYASGVWSEQMVVKKDGNITNEDLLSIIAPATTTGGLTTGKVSYNGVNDFYYSLKKYGDTTGNGVAIYSSPDGVISTAGGNTTFTRDVQFTGILEVDSRAPSNATHRLRYCYH